MKAKKNNINSIAESAEDLRFSDLFNLDEIQVLQDLFSDATGVAVVISEPDGNPVTKPSNFRSLCMELIRTTEKGKADCHECYTELCRQNFFGPAEFTCKCGGMLDAGVRITIKGKHIANMVIGQIRLEGSDEQRVTQYADEIGLKKKDFLKAFYKVPVISDDQFSKVKKMLFAYANELSEKAYINLKLKTYIAEREKAEQEILKLNKYLEQRIAERTNELEAMNKELAFHINELQQFTYITSHDLQEPLQTLTNFAELIKEEYGGKLDEDGNKYIDYLFRSAVRMSDLVKGLLDYSLLGKERITNEVDCGNLVNEVLGRLEELIKKANATVMVQKLPVIKSNETEMRMLFRNLVNNAIKFQPKGNIPVINITCEDGLNEWRFAVNDNGLGIEKKNREKIFVIFKRLHNRDEYEGIGIGLSLCKKIIELNGGRIWVESTPGEGSTFYFTIPKG
jgi:signal transduction histidine kinase